MRALAKAVFVLVLVALLGGAALLGSAYYLNQPPDRLPAPGRFTIEKGESLGRIAARLQSRGHIRSSLLLRLYGKYVGTESRFQSGAYTLTPGMSALEVHDYLTSGNQMLISVTIPEGWTLRRIARLLEEKGITGAQQFEAAAHDRDLLDRLGIRAQSAEGFLYPDTYRFSEGLPASAVVEHLVARFHEVLASIEPDYREMSWDDLYDTVILASIVEREYRSEAEAPKIASVFYNRLDEGMRLESCATVVYVMTEELGLSHPNRLYYRDLERRSPYNTYRNADLPPGPIANPGGVALDAAFHPSTTDYRFFVLRGPGADEHHFSHSLSEHAEAALLYLKTP